MKAIYTLILSLNLFFLQNSFAEIDPSPHVLTPGNPCGAYLLKPDPGARVEFFPKLKEALGAEIQRDVTAYLAKNFLFGMPTVKDPKIFRLIVVGPSLPQKMLASFYVNQKDDGLEIKVKDFATITVEDCNRFWRGLAAYLQYPGYTFRYPVNRPLHLNTGLFAEAVEVTPGVMLKLFLAHQLDQRQVRALMRQVRSINFLNGEYQQVLSLPKHSYRLIYTLRDGRLYLKTIYSRV